MQKDVITWHYKCVQSAQIPSPWRSPLPFSGVHSKFEVEERLEPFSVGGRTTLPCAASHFNHWECRILSPRNIGRPEFGLLFCMLLAVFRRKKIWQPRTRCVRDEHKFIFDVIMQSVSQSVRPSALSRSNRCPRLIQITITATTDLSLLLLLPKCYVFNCSQVRY